MTTDGWRTDMENAPSGLHVRGVWVHSATTKERLYWQVDVGSLYDGWFVGSDGDDFGVRPEDYTHWCSLPPPPQEDAR